MVRQLRRELGLIDAVVIGLGSIVGTGAYVSIGLSTQVAGASIMVAILLAAVTALANGFSSAQLAAAHPVSGGTYEYGYRYINATAGRLAGILFIVAKSASAATAALAVAYYIGSFANIGTITVKTIAVALLLLFTLLVLVGVKRTNWLNLMLVIIALLGLTVFIYVGLTNPTHEPVTHLSWQPQTWHAAALVFVAFTGYGRIATMGEEVQNPRKTIPLALVITLAISTMFYLLIGLTLLSHDTTLLAEQQLNIAYLLADPDYRLIVLISGGVAMSGVVLNLLLGVSRVFLAMGRRKDLPAVFARLNRTQQSAPLATWASFTVMVAIVIVGGIESAWSLSALTVLVYYGITNLAALKVSSSQRFVPRWVHVFGLISCCGLALWLAVSYV